MHRSSLRRRFLAAPFLALALAACGSGGDSAGQSAGEPIAKVEAPQGQQWSQVVRQTPEGGYLMGNPDAPIKLLEYGSLTCPACAQFAKDSDKELRETFVDSGRVSFEFRNFVRDGIDLTGAMLSRCGTPENFFALTHEVFAHQESFFNRVENAGQQAYTQAMSMPADRRFIALGELTGLTDFFAARGISQEQGNNCLANAATADTLAKSVEQQAQQYDIQGTPTFFINGEKAGVTSWDEIKSRLEARGAR